MLSARRMPPATRLPIGLSVIALAISVGIPSLPAQALKGVISGPVGPSPYELSLRA